MTYTISDLRNQFPALRNGTAFFDAPGGTQVPSMVANAMSFALTGPTSNIGRTNASSVRAARIVRAARRAISDFMLVEPEAVVFGRSATQLTFEFANTIVRNLRRGDEIAVSRLDHDANVRPWVIAGERYNVPVRWIDFDKATGDLSVTNVRDSINANTKIVAVTGCSNLLGTLPDIKGIASAVHSVGAELYLDAVAMAPHVLIDFSAIGADYIVCSPYKFCGPHIGVLVSSVGRLEKLHPDKLAPSTDDIPFRFELGTLPYELLSGVSAAIDFLSTLSSDAVGSRRRCLEISYKEMANYESDLFNTLVQKLAKINGLRRIGNPAKHSPTFLFELADSSPVETAMALGEEDISVSYGTFYAFEPAKWMGIGEGGAIRVGLAPYTSLDDVQRLASCLQRHCGLS